MCFHLYVSNIKLLCWPELVVIEPCYSVCARAIAATAIRQCAHTYALCRAIPAPLCCCFSLTHTPRSSVTWMTRVMKVPVVRCMCKCYNVVFRYTLAVFSCAEENSSGVNRKAVSASTDQGGITYISLLTSPNPPHICAINSLFWSVYNCYVLIVLYRLCDSCCFWRCNCWRSCPPIFLTVCLPISLLVIHSCAILSSVCYTYDS